MRITKRLVRRSLLASLFLLVGSASYAAVFARELRCQFVGWSDLKKADEHMYLDSQMSRDQTEHIAQIVAAARERDAEYYGSLMATPIIITGPDERVIQKFGQPGNSVAVTHLYLGNAYIVLGPDGQNIDVVAHETMHAELSKRIGWLKKQMKIPAWFDEGLAMQTDYREAYSEEAWQSRTNSGALAPPLSKLKSESAFNSADYWIAFATSKHELKRWYAIVGKQGLNEFVQMMQSGSSFSAAYSTVERKYDGF